MVASGAVLVVRSSPSTLPEDVDRAVEFAVAGGLDSEKVTLVKINGNFNMRYPGSNTSSWFLDALLGRLRDRRFRQLTVVEGDLPEFRATDMIHSTGLDEVLERHGVPFLPLAELPLDGRRLPIALRGSQLVNVPVFHTHGQAVISCGTKNLFGLLPRDRRRYHGALEEKLLELYRAVPCFTVVDGTVGLDGESTRRGNPVHCDLVLAGADPLEVDWVVSQIMGFGPDEIPVLHLARRQGLLSSPPRVEGDFGADRLPRYRFELRLSLVRKVANLIGHTPLVGFEPLWKVTDVLRVRLHRLNKRVKAQRLRQGSWTAYETAYLGRVGRSA